MPVDFQERMNLAIDTAVDLKFKPAVDTASIEGRQASARLNRAIDSVMATRKIPLDTTSAISEKFEETSLSNSASTERLADHITAQSAEISTQPLSLHRKVDQVDESIGAIRDNMDGILRFQSNYQQASRSAEQKGSQVIVASIFVILTGTHQLI